MVVLSVTPSLATEIELRGQKDNNYYSPCSNYLLLRINILAYGTIEPIHDPQLGSLVLRTFKDLRASKHSGNSASGYFSQHDLVESGITAWLAYNLRECFDAYCKYKNDSNLMDNLSIVHQSPVNSNCPVDIAVFHRIELSPTDDLIPMMFIEFTKNDTESKVNQTSVYANHLMQLTKVEHRRVPLLGLIMNDNKIDIKVYAITEVDRAYRIAEINIISFRFDHINFYRLLHMMYGWATECTKLLLEPQLQQKNLFKLRRNSNVLMLDDKVYKCYDYRSCSKNKSGTLVEERRCPEFYKYGEINMMEVIN